MEPMQGPKNVACAVEREVVEDKGQLEYVHDNEASICASNPLRSFPLQCTEHLLPLSDGIAFRSVDEMLLTFKNAEFELIVSGRCCKHERIVLEWNRKKPKIFYKGMDHSRLY